MQDSPFAELERPFDLFAPAELRAPVLFSSPHSGRIYPRAFLAASRLDATALRRSEDSYVDELFADVVALGVPLLAARFPRAFVDVNREPYELDPRMFADRLPAFANTRSVRVAGGLGTIARIVADSQEIYQEPLSLEDALARIERLYRPYHQALADTLVALRRRFGVAFLVDCHSMPSAVSGEERSARPDIVIGDRYGTTCAGAFTDRVQMLFESFGYGVRRNRPYAGGHITERYGNPACGVHAIQLEVNRGLYMDEQSFARTANFSRLKSDLTAIAAALIASVAADRPPASAAAE